MKTIYTLAIALMSGVILTACGGTANMKNMPVIESCIDNPFGATCGIEFEPARTVIIEECRDKGMGSLCSNLPDEIFITSSNLAHLNLYDAPNTDENHNFLNSYGNKISIGRFINFDTNPTVCTQNGCIPQSNANAVEGQNGYAYYITNDNDGNIAYSYAGILDTTNVGLPLHSLDSPIATWRGEWSLNGVKPNTSNPSDDFILRVDYSGLHISGIGTKEIDGIDHTINVLGRYSVAGVIINGQADLVRSNVLYKGSLIGLIGHELAVGAFRSSDSDVSFAGGFIANPPAVDPVPYQNQSQRVFFPEIPVVNPLPDNGVLQADVQLATTAFLTQTEGDNLETGINFDTINNQAGESGIIGRLREIVQPEVPNNYSPVLFTPRVSQKAVSKGVDFNLVSFEMFSGTESLNDKDFAFMGFGYDGFHRILNNKSITGFRFVGYAGYNLASIDTPSVPTTATANYHGRLGVIAVSDNRATEELLNAENRVNATINISLQADFSAGTFKSTHTTYLIEDINTGSLGRVVVNGTFATGDTALGGTVDFFLPSIFTRDNDAPISTTLQGVIDRNLAIGAFHGADASVAIVGGFIARSPSN